MLELLFEQKQITGHILGTLAFAGWTKSCCNKNESRLSLKLQNKNINKPLFMTLVFNWEKGRAFLVFSQKEQLMISHQLMNRNHQLELGTTPLSPSFCSHIKSWGTPTFRTAERDLYMVEVRKDSQFKKEVLKHLDSLTEILDLPK